MDSMKLFGFFVIWYSDLPFDFAQGCEPVEQFRISIFGFRILTKNFYSRISVLYLKYSRDTTLIEPCKIEIQTLLKLFNARKDFF